MDTTSSADSDIEEMRFEEELSDPESSSVRRRARFNVSDSRDNDEHNQDNFVDNNKRSNKKRCSAEIEHFHYRLVNEKFVNDITLEALYKPHTLTVLALLCAYLMYKAFSGDDDLSDNNIFSGLKASAVLFLILGAMAFPNGPFIRPHPIFWRIIFGVSVLYILLLQFTLFQSYNDIKKVLSWLDPVGLSHTSLDEKEYATNCSDLTLERVWSHMDIFAVGHFLGWAMKALLIRHTVVFAHLLPNFLECWWDAIFLDIILCNGLGILFGNWVAHLLEMRSFHWESIKGKVKRAVLQFTPESWLKVEWLNIFPLKRCLAIYAFIMVWLISELNTFFLKHVFSIDTSHPVVFWRIILIGLISAPSIRQYYLYATDPKIKRIGMQCWVYMAAIGTVFCVWISVVWAKYSSLTKDVEVVGGETRQCYLDSSCENLGALKDDVFRRRRDMELNNSAFSS